MNYEEFNSWPLKVKPNRKNKKNKVNKVRLDNGDPMPKGGKK